MFKIAIKMYTTAVKWGLSNKVKEAFLMFQKTDIPILFYYSEY